MKAAEIKIGSYYIGKVSGHDVPLKVLETIKRRGHSYGAGRKARGGTAFSCLNMLTGRTITARSAARFHRELTELQVKEFVDKYNGAANAKGQT